MSSSPLLAKSANYGEVPLVDHLRAVGEAARHFAGHFGLDESLAYQGGILHDIGKAHPYFQEVHLDRRGPTPREQRRYGMRPPFRHELSSLLFLPLFPEASWPLLLEMVVAHHKSIIDDPKGRGLLDLCHNHRYYQELHVGEWEDWSPAAVEVLGELGEDLGIGTRELPREEALAALNWAEAYCDELGNGWSEWRGLLMAADHFVSGLEKLREDPQRPLFQVPDTSAFVREHPLFPLSQREAAQREPHTLLLAPTGAGKTDYLLRRCRGRIFYVLPFQASINAMHKRLKEAMPEADVRLQHGASKLVDLEDRQDGEQPEQSGRLAATLQSLVGSGAKVLTPFQLASIVFAGHGFEAQILDIRGCDVILDEIHTYSEKAQAIVFALVRELLRHGCRVHVGTATMPSALYKRLKTQLAGHGGVAEVALTPEELDTYDRHRVHKAAADDWPAILDEAVQNGEKVLVVFNTVKGAQEAFEQVETAHPTVEKMLIHSRFRRMDRQRLETRLKDEFEDGSGPCIVVSTQVVEVSLDISFDRMITESAPLDALIQRFGRVNRRRTSESLGQLRPVHVLEPAERVLPYQKPTVQASYERLPDDGVLKANALQALLDEVYPELDTQPIDTHLAWRENGRFKRRKLTHVSEPILLQLLEIDQDVCILAEDEAAYCEGNWIERSRLEIPVNGRSLRPYRQYYPRLEGFGNEPLIIRDQRDYACLGLILKEPDNFY